MLYFFPIYIFVRRNFNVLRRIFGGFTLVVAFHIDVVDVIPGLQIYNLDLDLFECFLDIPTLFQ